MKRYVLVDREPVQIKPFYEEHEIAEAVKAVKDARKDGRNVVLVAIEHDEHGQPVSNADVTIGDVLVASDPPTEAGRGRG